VSTLRLSFLSIFALATLVATGGIAQDVPDTPETPESAAASEAEPVAETEPEADPESTANEEPAGPAGPLFETTVSFELVKKTTLEGKAGEIEIRGVEFGSKGAKGGVFGSSDADLKATISAQFDCSTTAEKKQKVSFTIQFLDGNGDLIDRASNNGSLKEESKLIDVNLTTLRYVVPLIKQVKITAKSKVK